MTVVMRFATAQIVGLRIYCNKYEFLEKWNVSSMMACIHFACHFTMRRWLFDHEISSLPNTGLPLLHILARAD